MHMTVHLNRGDLGRTITVHPVRQEGRDGLQFDTVKIEDWREPSLMSVAFLVPAGKGEQFAAALRELFLP